MHRIGIIGATGYTALELTRILARHPDVQLTRLTSREAVGKQVGVVHSSLRHLDLEFTSFEPADFCGNVDFAFSCLPHAASAPIVESLLDNEIKVVDFSADYRLNDVASFEHWYQVTHPAPKRFGSVPYGIPELFRSQIEEADLVANPGCFPSSAIIPLTPLLESSVVQTDSVIVDSKTGISGAGRKANLKFHFPEANESVAAYGVGTHRHAPEMEQILERKTGVKPRIVFTPHLIPMNRGILSTIYAKPNNGNTADTALNCLKSYYQQEPFIRVVDELPSTKDVMGTNFCDVTVRESNGMLVICSAIDNLAKGASTAAVQNFNLMNGLDETTALL